MLSLCVSALSQSQTEPKILRLGYIQPNYCPLQILDATFDELLPLAVPRMPASLSGIVTRAVNKYINLNVAEQLAKYPGPVRIIRRDHDEMICTRYNIYIIRDL